MDVNFIGLSFNFSVLTAFLLPVTCLFVYINLGKILELRRIERLILWFLLRFCLLVKWS